MTDNNWQGTTAAFLIGLGVGAGIGILLAPKSGDETRKDIAGAVKDGANQVVARGRDLGRRSQDAMEDAKDRLREAADTGAQAYREAKAGSSS
jgi:gas vesicle protein